MWYPQVSFRNGEVSPRLDGLANPQVYEASCRKVEGAIVSSTGSIEKRGGTRFIDDTAFSTTEPDEADQTYTSDACKLISMVHGSDIYVLVFEVLNNGTDTWGVIRAVVNNEFITSVGEDAPTADSIWTEFEKSNLPFKSPSAAVSPIKYFPPGTNTAGLSNGYTGIFGLHNFTAEQLPELQYFQHEQLLIVMHPDEAPIQVYATTDNETGKVTLNTSPYKCAGRSPAVKYSKGERFSMVVTTASTGGGWFLETTRDWFGEDDVGAIYRIGHSVKRPWYESAAEWYLKGKEHGNTRWGDDNRGVYAIVTSIKSPRKAQCQRASFTGWNPGNPPDPKYRFPTNVSDPLDWDGPWVMDPLPVSELHFTHAQPPKQNAWYGANATPNHYSAAGYKPGYPFPNPPTLNGNLDHKCAPPWVILQNTTIEGSGCPAGLNQMVGCIVTKAGSGKQDYTTGGKNFLCHAMVALTGSASGLEPAELDEKHLVCYPMTGGYLPNWNNAYYPTWRGSVPGAGGGSETANAASNGPHVIFRLRDKRTKELLPTITISRLYLEYSSSTPEAIPGMYRKILAGDTCILWVGNIPAEEIGDHIPDSHLDYFDTYVRGDVADPTVAGYGTANPLDPTYGDQPINNHPMGGVIHVNGGTFALIVKKDNCFIARCIVAPIHQSITSKFSLGWSRSVGFPSCGVSHQGRVIFSGFRDAKSVVVGSIGGDPENFALGADASSGIHFIVNDLRGSKVNWLASGKDLIVGTDSSEFSITGSPLSALSVGVDRQSAYGSSSIKSLIVGNILLFVQKDKKTVRAMKFNFDNQRYTSQNITVGHEHLFLSATIEEMILWEGEEDPVVMVRLSDGEVLACRVNETAGFYGWSRMKLPLCSSMCPSRNETPPASGRPTTGDDFYLSLNDTGKFRLIRFEDQIYMDEAVTPATADHDDGQNELVITLPAGISHLDGETVSVKLDGLYRGEWLCTGAVAGSTITVTGEALPTAADTIRVGKKISMAVQPRVPESVGTPRTPSTLGRTKNISSVVANLNGSRGVKVNGYEVDNNFTTDSGTVLPPLSQGWFEVPVAGLYGLQPLVEVSTDRPYPAEIVGISIDMSTEG